MKDDKEENDEEEDTRRVSNVKGLVGRGEGGGVDIGVSDAMRGGSVGGGVTTEVMSNCACFLSLCHWCALFLAV